MKSRFIRVPSTRAIFATETLVAVIPQEINGYGIIIRGFPGALKADGSDIDFIIEQLGGELASKEGGDAEPNLVKTSAE